jgi:hypothetical protein
MCYRCDFTKCERDLQLSGIYRLRRRHGWLTAAVNLAIKEGRLKFNPFSSIVPKRDDKQTPERNEAIRPGFAQNLGGIAIRWRTVLAGDLPLHALADKPSTISGNFIARIVKSSLRGESLTLSKKLRVLLLQFVIYFSIAL